MTPLFVIERSLRAPPAYAAAWLQGKPDAPLAWTVTMLGGRVVAEHRLVAEGEGDGARLAVSVATSLAALRLLRGPLRAAIERRSARLAGEMARDFERGEPAA